MQLLNCVDIFSHTSTVAINSYNYIVIIVHYSS